MNPREKDFELIRLAMINEIRAFNRKRLIQRKQEARQAVQQCFIQQSLN